MIIRPMSPADWPVVRAIYDEGIATRNATFITAAPEWAEWDTGHLAHCRLVAEDREAIAGWAALSPVSSRCVYAGVAEVSVYVAGAAQGRGIGRALLSALVTASEAEGLWTLQAGILPENIASVAIHEHCGFRIVGRRERLGKMDGVWRDVLLLGGVRHNWRAMRAALPLLLCLVASIPAAAQSSNPGGLDPGPHAVGYGNTMLLDTSRPMGPRVPASERQTSRARQLRIHIWYPAAAASGTPLTMADYLGAGAATHRQDVARVLALTIGDTDWTRYTSQAMRALRETAPGAGPFPLLVGMGRAASVAVGAEYLASHGYVVAFVERQAREPFAAEGLTLEGLVINEHQRDLQMVIARMRRDAHVDPARLGLIGLAADGLASLALAMRHPDVDAVALLESNWLQPSGASIYQQVAAFDPTALRAPLLFGYSEILGRNALEQVANIEAMRYASRHLLYFGEPRMTPLDFGTEGVVLAALLEQRKAASAGVTRAFQVAHKYMRTFLDAYVKGDASAVAALATVPTSGTSGALIELTSWPAVTPALSRTDLRTLLDADLTKALARARADLKNDPKAQVFDAAWLNSQGYDAAIRGLTDRAIAIYTLATEAAPRSANAFDSLSDMLERVGRKADALAAAEKGLALLPADKTVTAAERAQLETLLRGRVARLK